MQKGGRGEGEAAGGMLGNMRHVNMRRVPVKVPPWAYWTGLHRAPWVTDASIDGSCRPLGRGTTDRVFLKIPACATHAIASR